MFVVVVQSSKRIKRKKLAIQNSIYISQVRYVFLISVSIRFLNTRNKVFFARYEILDSVVWVYCCKLYREGARLKMNDR